MLHRRSIKKPGKRKMTEGRTVFFITHAEVKIDPVVPVPRWGLSEIGRARHERFSGLPVIARVASIYSSAEQKALDAAEILGAAIGVKPAIVEQLHENDRSATGYLPPQEFNATADIFFAKPTESVRGWERAIDAQERIVKCTSRILAEDQGAADIAIVAHGGVGTLLLCHLRGEAIRRIHDQPGRGGGNYFAFDAETWALCHGWKDISPPQSPIIKIGYLT